MFHPVDRPMERGWVGRIDGDRVVHLAAQTLQHFFTGGGGAREHAEYPLAEVTVLVPVLQPPTVRLFAGEEDFAFGNPSAVLGPGAAVPQVEPSLAVALRLAVVIGLDGAIGGFTMLVEWLGRGPGAKANDFGLVLGPVVVTDIEPAGLALTTSASDGRMWSGTSARFDWERALAVAARGTTLRTGDVVAGPPASALDGIAGGGVEATVAGIGTLSSGLVPLP